MSHRIYIGGQSLPYQESLSMPLQESSLWPCKPSWLLQ
jgi:hypothetical protein